MEKEMMELREGETREQFTSRIVLADHEEMLRGVEETKKLREAQAVKDAETVAKTLREHA